MSLKSGEKIVILEHEKSAQLPLIQKINSEENEETECKEDHKNLNKAAVKKGENACNVAGTCIDLKNKEAKGKLPETIVSIPNNGTKKKDVVTKKRKRTLSFIDTLLSLVVIAPSVIGYWRGIWTLMDLHVDIFPPWPTFFWGLGVHIVFTLFREQFSTLYMKMHSDKSPVKRLAYQTTRIIYIYLFGVACNAHWRCGWIILDEVFQNDVWIIVSLKLLLLFALTILRCLRNVLAPPFIIAVDKPGYIFEFPTRYNVVSVNVYRDDSIFYPHST